MLQGRAKFKKVNPRKSTFDKDLLIGASYSICSGVLLIKTVRYYRFKTNRYTYLLIVSKGL